MRIHLWILIVAMGVPAVADAGVFGRRKAKGDPAQRVPALATTLLNDLSESRRAWAASELRRYDATKFPQIVGSLMYALRRDPSSSVRAAAAESLGKIRPTSRTVGRALDQAKSGDGSIRVRWAARTALWQYSLAGYRAEAAKPTPPPSKAQTGEPPLAGSGGGKAGTPEPPKVPAAPPAVPLPMGRPPLGAVPAPGGSGPVLDPPFAR